MANVFFEHLQRFEVIAFFSGYPIIYLIFRLVLPVLPIKTGTRDRMRSLWPVAYAILGALYLGLQGRNVFLDRSGSHLPSLPWNQFLQIWGISAIFLGIPPLVRRPVLSFGHSLVFFSLITWDIIIEIFGHTADETLLRNEMRLYTVSLFLTTGVFLLVAVCYFRFIRYKRSNGPLKR